MQISQMPISTYGLHYELFSWACPRGGQLETATNRMSALTDREDISSIDSQTDDLQPKRVLLLNDDVLVGGLVAVRIGGGVELDVLRNRMTRDEAAERADLGEDAHLVHLRDDAVEHFALERPEHDRPVLDLVDGESGVVLDEAIADVIDRGDRDHEAVFAGARAFYLGEQLALDGLQQLRSEVSRMQFDFVLQRDVVEHGGDFCLVTVANALEFGQSNSDNREATS